MLDTCRQNFQTKSSGALPPELHFAHFLIPRLNRFALQVFICQPVFNSRVAAMVAAAEEVVPAVAVERRVPEEVVANLTTWP